MSNTGGLAYASQNPAVLIGSKTKAGVRTSLALTAAYDVANKTKAFETGGMSKLNLDILYTTGATETGSSLNLRVRCSNDGVNYYRIPNETVSGGTSTLTDREVTRAGGAGATVYNYSFGLDIFYKYMDISVKESGVVTNFGTIFIDSTLSGQ